MLSSVLEATRRGETVLKFREVSLEILSTQERWQHWQANQGLETEFFMAKSTPYIEGYNQITQAKPPKTIFELGIFKGGSVVFLDQAFSPTQLTAIDLSTARIPKLDAYASNIAKSKIRLEFGVNQADKATLRKIMDRDFPNGIDMVIDDASHFYAPSKASFEAIFPRVNAGGNYVVEDWSWSHTNPSDGGVGNEDVTRLLVELISLHAKRPDIVEKIYVQGGFFCLTRGWAKLPDNFTV